MIKLSFATNMQPGVKGVKLYVSITTDGAETHDLTALFPRGRPDGSQNGSQHWVKGRLDLRASLGKVDRRLGGPYSRYRQCG